MRGLARSVMAAVMAVPVAASGQPTVNAPVVVHANSVEAKACAGTSRADADGHPPTLSEAFATGKPTINDCPAETITIDPAMAVAIAAMRQVAQVGAGVREYRTYLMVNKAGVVHVVDFTEGSAQGAVFDPPNTPGERLVAAAHTHPHELSFSPNDLVNAEAGFKKPSMITLPSGMTYVAFMNFQEFGIGRPELFARATHLSNKLQCAQLAQDPNMSELARSENSSSALADLMRGQIYVLKPGETVMHRLRPAPVAWLEQSDMSHWPHDRFEDIVIRAGSIVLSGNASGKTLDSATLGQPDQGEAKPGMDTLLSTLYKMGARISGSSGGYILADDSKYPGDVLVINPLLVDNSCDYISLILRRRGDPNVTHYAVWPDNTVRQAEEPDPWNGQFFQ